MLPVLIIDDNDAVRTALSMLFEIHDIPCLTASSPQEGLARVSKQEPGVVIQDMNFTENSISGEEGVRLFRSLRRLYPDLPILLITAWTSLETAVSLVREGARDYLGKPWDDAKLVNEVTQILSTKKESGQKPADPGKLCGLVYADPKMEEVVFTALRVAKADVPVLVTGPNGAGKEMLAHIIQSNSPRCDKPFVTVNAGAMPAELFESELFGVEPGAFTGAQRRRIGRFEEADGGTLFLDEIGNLPLEGQIKLLRVLQTGEFSRLGANRVVRCDVRVISATNADLKAAIREGSFREDLYFRLNLVELHVPSLASRPADILPLAHHFFSRLPDARGKKLGATAEAALLAYDWPGNVRELHNRIQRSVLVGAGSTIEAQDLGLDLQRSASPGSEISQEASSDPLRLGIEDALRDADGNVSKAAAQLGISRQAFYRRMEKYGIVWERSFRLD